MGAFPTWNARSPVIEPKSSRHAHVYIYICTSIVPRSARQVNMTRHNLSLLTTAQQEGQMAFLADQFSQTAKVQITALAILKAARQDMNNVEPPGHLAEYNRMHFQI